jgi:hypothetical protein
LRTAIALLTVLILVAVAPGKEKSPSRDAKLRAALTPIRVAREADSIVLARMEEIHESPEIWCGILATRQFVTYEVVEHLYGEKPDRRIRIGHLLVHGSKTVLPDRPHLRFDRFHPGARAILCLKRVEDRWTAVEEDSGVVLVDPPIAPDSEVRALVGRCLNAAALRPYLHPDRPGRVPVAVAISRALPLPLDLEMFGKKVRFGHPEVLAKTPHFVFTAIECDAKSARVRFCYDVEGLVGDVSFTRTKDGFRITKYFVAEK